MKKLGLAIAGAGWIADFYYEAYQNLSDRFTLVGCSGNPSAEGRKRLAAKCGKWNTKAFDSFDEILENQEVDCIGIMSPTNFHFDQAKKAIEKGKHVLVEKPVTLNQAELKELYALSNTTGCVVFPGHNFVYRPVIREAKKIIESGKLGNVSYASLRAVHFIPEDHAAGWRKSFSQSGGGAMMDSGTHLVYQLLYLMGDPKWLSCFKTTKHYKTMDGEDTCQISLQYEDGRIAQVFQSWSSSDGDAGEIRIQGDKGNLLINGKGLHFNSGLLETDGAYDRSFMHTLSAFYEAIVSKTPGLSGVIEAEKTLEIIQSAYKAAESRDVLELLF